MLSIIQSIVLVFSIFAFLAALVSQGVYLSTRKFIARASADGRVRILELLVILPVLITVFVIIKGFAPSMLTLLGMPQEHCISHCLIGGSDHIHLCLITPPEFISNPVILLLFTALVGVFFFNLYRIVYELIQGRRLIVQLKQLAVYIPGPNYYRIESDEILALSMGFFRPAVFVSAGLEARLSSRELALVLEHEYTHARRRDLLRNLLMKFVGIFFIPRILKQILADISLGSEQICDQQATKKVNSRFLVAETIVKVQRLVSETNRPTAALASYFSENHIASRVAALIDDQPVQAQKLFSISAYFLIISAVVFFVAEQDAIHHLVEMVYNSLL